MIDRQELIALLDKLDVGQARVPQTDQGVLSFRETLADAIGKLADSCSRNIPRGLYRNRLGAEIRVFGWVGDRVGVNVHGLRTLGGDIAYAESFDDLFGTRDRFIVTEDSLRNCGYELVEPAED